MDPVLVGRIVVADELLGYDIRELEIVKVNGDAFLYASTGRSGGLTAYSLGPSGTLGSLIDTLAFEDTAFDPPNLTLESIAFANDGALVVGVDANGEMMTAALETNGQLADLSGSFAPGTTEISNTALTAIETSGGQLAYAWIDASDGSLNGALQGANSDSISQLDTSGSASAFAFGEGTSLASGETSETALVFAADAEHSKVSVFSVQPNTGALSYVDNTAAVSTIGIGSPTALEMVSAFGTNFLIVAGAASSSLSVFHISPTGELTATDHIIDTHMTRFGGVQAITTVQSGDFTFLVAAGADDGLSLFTMLPEGRLLHVSSIEHLPGDGLQNVVALTAHVVGDEVQVFASSSTTAGVSQFAFSLADLDEIEVGDHTSGSRLDGGAGSDMLIANSVSINSLRGGSGDDWLISGLGNVELRGDSGADTFVIGRDGSNVEIRDFERGVDKVDLSALTGLRDIRQISISNHSDGISLSYGSTKIRIRTDDREQIEPEEIFGYDFDWADRLTSGFSPPSMVASTSREGGFFRGTEGADLIYGNTGSDNIWSQEGSDTLRGGLGNDNLGGGDGNDEIWGDDDSDTLFGGSGDDTLFGGEGNDNVWGGTDQDAIRGGDGDDALGGFIGNDSIWGGTGADLIFGDIGDDLLYGGNGQDTLWAGTDEDLSYGESGNDLMGGGEGNDTLYGGSGSDFIYGGNGDDVLDGSNGQDTIYAGPGDDAINGGSNPDILSGGPGDDILTGGSGADQFGFGVAQGADTITDFESDDTLALWLESDFTFGELDMEETSEGHTLIDMQGGTILLEDVSISDLSAEQFLFL